MTMYPIVKTKVTERTARKIVKYLAVSDINGSSSVTISVFVTFVMIYSLAFVELLEFDSVLSELSGATSVSV